MLKRFLSYYKPHKTMFAIDMLASLLISAIGMLYPIVTNNMLNIYIPERQTQKIVLFGIVLMLLYIVRMLLRYFVQYYGHIIGKKMQAQMRSELFAHLQKLPYTYYDNNETGKIMSRMTNDLFDISELAHHGPENLIIGIIMVVGSFIYLCTISIPLTLIIFICVPLLIIVSAFTRKRMTAAFKERRKAYASINAATESSISGVRVAKAFTNSKKEVEKFEAGNKYFVDSSKDAYSAMGIFHSSSSFVTDVFNVIVLVAGGFFLYGEHISFGDYSTFIISVNLFINPINLLIGFVEQYQNGVTGFERFLEVMDEEPEKDTPHARPIKGRARGDISLENIEFSYNDTKEDVIRNLTLHVRAGEKVALVGPSGGGKTTICHLIPSFYKLQKGKISVDGVDINDITLESLRQNIGIVMQDVFLFGGTIKDNILYGRLDATDAEVEEAARRANIHDYIMTLPNGYDTDIGERGVKLSGGQKQRLSIARVFLKNPAILILDEATSALDNTTEILIQKALDELCEGRTTIVVAHRLSTVKNADRIAVISDGRIVEEGSHAELLEKEDGEYKKLWELQFKSNS